MTTLYKPVLIESAEQAEALPAKTFAVHSNSGRSAYRIMFGGGVFWHEGMSQLEPRDLLGWSALVPVEAEEEHVAPDAITYSRYVTAWEEA